MGVAVAGRAHRGGKWLFQRKRGRPLSTVERLTPYPHRHSGTLLVVGSAKSALAELNEAKGMRPEIQMVAVVGHAAGFVKADFVVSDHYEVHEELRCLQDDFGTDHYTTHCTHTRAKNRYSAVDYWWPWRRSEASSLQTAIRLGLAVGFSEIILCGCPLEHGTIQHPAQRMKDGYQWPPPRDVETHGWKRGLDTSEEILASFRKHFELFSKDWKGHVFSMSGFTRQALGYPPSLPVTKSDARDRVTRFWSGKHGIDNVYPSRFGVWPDGDEVHMLRRTCDGYVCDVGCGTGRCAQAFTSGAYMGVDINPDVIAEAHRIRPNFRFEAIEWDDPLPTADTYLFYTVLLHIPNDQLFTMILKTKLANAKCRIVIGETMLREVRKPDRGTFNRDVKEYVDMLSQCGFKRVTTKQFTTKVPPHIKHVVIAQ